MTRFRSAITNVTVVLSTVCLLTLVWGRITVLSAEPSEADRVIQTLEDSVALKKSSTIQEYSDIQVKSYQTGMRLGTKTFRKSHQDVASGIYQIVYKIVKGKWLPGEPSSDVWRRLKYRGAIDGAHLWGRQVIHSGEVLYELVMQKNLKGLHIELLLRTRKFSDGKQVIDERFKNFLANIKRNKVSDAGGDDDAPQEKPAKREEQQAIKPARVGAAGKTAAEELVEKKVPATADREEAESVTKEVATPEPTATPTSTPTPTPKPTLTPEPTATPTPKPTAEPTATPTPKPAATPEPTPTPELVEENSAESHPVIGTWEGTVKSTRDGKTEDFRLRIYNVDEESFDGDWQTGIPIKSGTRRGRMYVWEANNLQNGCRDFRARLDVRPDLATAGVIVLVRDRCDKPAQFSSSGILRKK